MSKGQFESAETGRLLTFVPRKRWVLSTRSGCSDNALRHHATAGNPLSNPVQLDAFETKRKRLFTLRANSLFLFQSVRINQLPNTGICSIRQSD
jgi:hypothetical protein